MREERREVIDKNVFILGAGASAAGGAPIMSDFVNQMFSLYERRKPDFASDDIRRFKKVYDCWLGLFETNSILRLDLNNIEDFFGLVDILATQDKNMNEVLNSLTYCIARTLELMVKDPMRDKQECPVVGHGTLTELLGNIQNVKGTFDRLLIPSKKFLMGEIDPDGTRTISSTNYELWLYHLFAFLIKQSGTERGTVRDSIITFNYDLQVDHALADVGLFVDYRLGTSFKDRRDDSRRSKPKATLLKLHGSANWARCSNRDCTYKAIYPEHPKLAGKGESYLRSWGNCHKCKKGHLVPLIVPPTWNKSLYWTEVASIWSRAVGEIREASRIFIIGYSMPETDVAFKYLLAAGMVQRKCRLTMIQVINCDNQAIERVKNLLNPFLAQNTRWFCPRITTFENAIGNTTLWEHAQRMPRP